MLNKNIETFIACDADYPDAAAVLYGAPYDGTTSFRPGTRFGPHAVRAESYGLETYSPYQDADLTDYSVFDSGDLELPYGSVERVLAMIEERAQTILADGKLPFCPGNSTIQAERRGNHGSKIERQVRAHPGYDHSHRSHHLPGTRGALDGILPAE